ncbi:MAG: citrate synthase [Rickettsiaceae bacterium H1]|nr:citrate synthase [Rickettsiaceae bacterium H1]
MAKLLIDKSEFELSLIKSTNGTNAIDVRNLYKESGLFTYDPGFMSTASCSSAITFINGEKGILQYRGYNVADLAEKHDFLTVAYLLLCGNLPSNKELKSFNKKIKNYSKLKTGQIIKSFPTKAHPMSILIGSFAGLAATYNNREEDYRIVAIAQVPSIIAGIYRHVNNLPPIESDDNLSYAENFLHMMFGEKKFRETFAKSLDIIFTLHADHEQNASTSTVKLAASSGANPFACLAAGSATLWGPAHGGANEAVIKMLNDIGSTENISKFIRQVKNKESRLMGFGHRVYKNHDPRATILRGICRKVVEVSDNQNSQLLKTALTLEEIALHDEYFLERKLYPNVDFYSGIILKSLEIPTDMFTCLFALARTTGWVTQLHESINDKEQKIGRPRQVYIGEKPRKL